jgi:hypothetical protein
VREKTVEKKCFQCLTPDETLAVTRWISAGAKTE